MKQIISILLFIFCSISFGQKMEFFGGINSNTFYDWNKETPHYSSTYKSGTGYSFGFGLDSVKAEWLTLSFTLTFENYGGELEAKNGGLGGSYTTTAKINKSLITLGVYPINFHVVKKLHISIGGEMSRLISESFSGTRSGSISGQSSWSDDLKDKYDEFSTLSYWGIKSRLIYDFVISKSLVITPQYSFYFGLSNEFIKFPKETKSMRHFLGLGLKKVL